MDLVVTLALIAGVLVPHVAPAPAATTTEAHTHPYAHACPRTDEEFDFIVVGAGSSGAVVASRLSESRSARVLLLEAGSAPSKVADIPLLTRQLMDTDMNWDYVSERQANCCLAYANQAARIPSGKGLGGTSNINSMIYTRGNRYDYDRLKALDIKDWSYKDVLPIFTRMEKYQSIIRKADLNYHGYNGPQSISTPMYKSPLAEAFLQAGQELGHYQVDCNAELQTGFTPPPVNIKDGTRWGSYHAYLEPAIAKHKLHVISHALVSKIVFDNTKKATGVKFERRGSHCYVRVKHEVIVSAGALRSPQLLMLSGIGSRDQLDQFDIPTVADVPGVGQNLRDHVLATGIQFELDQPAGLKFTNYDTPENMKLWEKSRTGPLTASNAVEGIAFFRSRSQNLLEYSDHPAIEISMFTDKGLDPSDLAEPYRNSFHINDTKDYVTFIPILLQTRSSGSITLRSTNPRDAPLIDPKYLSHPEDVATLLEAVQIALSIGRTKSFMKFGAKLVKIGPVHGCEMFAPESDEFWACYFARFASASWHFTGSNKMGPHTDPMRVVDSRLRVQGVSGLRVADLSVMPLAISGHTHAVALMIGERAAEFIRSDYNL